MTQRKCKPGLESLRGLTGNAYHRAYRRLNVEQYHKSDKRWRDANPEKVRACCINWRKKHPEQLKANRKKNNTTYYAGAEKARQRYQRWDVVDDSAIMNKEVSDKLLSVLLGRSVKAIETRRCVLKQRNEEEL